MDCPCGISDGRFRWITKPFKRWAFARGERYTREFNARYATKYLWKFYKKQIKMGASETTRSVRTDMEGLIPLLTSRICPDRSVEKADREELRRLISSHVSDHVPDQAGRDEWVKKFAGFSFGLGEALEKNLGLDHSKVREYWLSRGPRLFMTALVYFAFTILCQETLKGANTRGDRAYTVVTNTTALLIAAFMLYKRLGDAIEGVVARSTHDFYVMHKKIEFRLLQPTQTTSHKHTAPLTTDAQPPAATSAAGTAGETRCCASAPSSRCAALVVEGEGGEDRECGKAHGFEGQQDAGGCKSPHEYEERMNGGNGSGGVEEAEERGADACGEEGWAASRAPDEEASTRPRAPDGLSQTRAETCSEVTLDLGQDECLPREPDAVLPPARGSGESLGHRESLDHDESQNESLLRVGDSFAGDKALASSSPKAGGSGRAAAVLRMAESFVEEEEMRYLQTRAVGRGGDVGGFGVLREDVRRPESRGEA